MGNGVNIPFSNILSVTKICPSLATLALEILKRAQVIHLKLEELRDVGSPKATTTRI